MRKLLLSLLLLFAKPTTFKKYFLKEQGRVNNFQNMPEKLLFLTVLVKLAILKEGGGFLGSQAEL